MNTSNPNKKNASIPLRFQPLPGRLNVVLICSGNSDAAACENVILCGSFTSALKLLAEPPYFFSIETVFLIGGGQILREALNAEECDAIHITEINSDVDCDTFIPPIDLSVYQLWYSSFSIEENSLQYCFATYVRLRTSTSIPENSGHEMISEGDTSHSKWLKLSDFTSLPKIVFEKHEEFLYLSFQMGTKKMTVQGPALYQNLVARCALTCGNLSLFLQPRGFSGDELLKSFYGSSVVRQMLRFYKRKGYTYGTAMHPENSSTVSSIGFKDREEGDLGPVYGFQWRHFGARCTNMHADYTGQGFDQLLDVIGKIKYKPDDRRIVLSAWNPSDLKLMALPPCHMLAQFR